MFCAAAGPGGNHAPETDARKTKAVSNRRKINTGLLSVGPFAGRPSPLEGSARPHHRQIAPVWGITVALFVGMTVGACGGPSLPKPSEGQVGFVSGFLGGVAADEPQAAQIGRDILSAGGTAADAAVATYFALAVTLPQKASLGGGGVCVVHIRRYRAKRGPRSGQKLTEPGTETIEFLASSPADMPPSATRPAAIPGNPRGFFALYSRHGRLRWQQLVAPGEQLARFGMQVSRAFGRDLGAMERALLAETETRRIFAPGGKALVKEGDFLVQTDLSAVLGGIRARGPGDFYLGQTARSFVSAAAEAGASISTDDMRQFTPQWREPVTAPFGNHVAYFPPPPAGAGALAAQMWSMIQVDDRFRQGDAATRLHLMVEAGTRAFADRGGWLREDGSAAAGMPQPASAEHAEALMESYRDDRHTPGTALRPNPPGRAENPAATSFVAVDRDGMAVACTVTANGLFGNGRIGRGTGILLAGVPGQDGRGGLSLGPMIVANPHDDTLYFAGAASGGKAAAMALINVAAHALIAGQSLEDAMAEPRVLNPGLPDVTYIEQGLNPALIEGLRKRGHSTSVVPDLGRVNAVICPNGLTLENPKCQIASDRRGFGLAADADR